MAISSNRKWKILAIALAVLLGISVGFNLYQSPLVHNEGKKETADFSFTWGPDSQKIVNGTFHLSLKMWPIGDNLTIVVTLNDDDCDAGDYLGLVFDINQNGYIDTSDESYGLLLDNLTGPSILLENGMLAWAQVRPTRGPHNVTFDPNTGYTFAVQFPFHLGGANWWNPAQVIRNGTENQLHVCFFDIAGEGKGGNWVFARFTFDISEES